MRPLSLISSDIIEYITRYSPSFVLYADELHRAKEKQLYIGCLRRFADSRGTFDSEGDITYAKAPFVPLERNGRGTVDRRTRQILRSFERGSLVDADNSLTADDSDEERPWSFDSKAGTTRVGDRRVCTGIVLALVLYSMAVTIFLSRNRNRCCVFPQDDDGDTSTGVNWLLSPDNRKNSSMLEPVSPHNTGWNEAELQTFATLCQATSPNSKCGLTCGRNGDRWFAPQQVLRRPHQGRTYVDDYICLRYDPDHHSSDKNIWAQPSGKLEAAEQERERPQKSQQYGWAAVSAEHTQSKLQFKAHRHLQCTAPIEIDLSASSQYHYSGTLLDTNEQVWFTLVSDPAYFYMFRVELDQNSGNDYLADSELCIYRDDTLSPAAQQLADGTGFEDPKIVRA